MLFQLHADNHLSQRHHPYFTDEETEAQSDGRATRLEPCSANSKVNDWMAILSTHMAGAILYLVWTDRSSLSVSSSLTWGLMRVSTPVRIKWVNNREVHKEMHV